MIPTGIAYHRYAESFIMAASITAWYFAGDTGSDKREQNLQCLPRPGRTKSSNQRASSSGYHCS